MRRRGLLACLATGTLACLNTAAAQQPDRLPRGILIPGNENLERMLLVQPGPRRVPIGLGADEVLERLKTFDADKNDQISRDELPERMKALVAKGDTNKDGVLDEGEILTLATSSSRHVSFGWMVTIPAGALTRDMRPPAKPGLEGLLEDLRLPVEKHARATAIAFAYKGVRTLDDPDAEQLLVKLGNVLDAWELEDFASALRRQRLQIRGGFVAGLVGGEPRR